MGPGSELDRSGGRLLAHRAARVTPRRLSADIVAALRDGKGLRIRAGTTHRFIGIWVVVVEGRVFVRSWSVKARSWYRAFLKDPRGFIQVGDRTIPVLAARTRRYFLSGSVFLILFCCTDMLLSPFGTLHLLCRFSVASAAVSFLTFGDLAPDRT